MFKVIFSLKHVEKNNKESLSPAVQPFFGGSGYLGVAGAGDLQGPRGTFQCGQ